MKKIKFWDVWDIRSVIYSIIVILILGSIFYFVRFPVTDSLRESKSETMTERTKGLFISSKNVDRESQGRMGNRTITDGLVIDYSYEVSGVMYYQSDKIPNSAKNQLFFNRLSKNPEMVLEIKYNKTHPEQSQINTDIK